MTSAEPELEADATTAEDESAWRPPPAQPGRIMIALAALAMGISLYGYVLLNFWSSPWLGIHSRIPFAAYAVIASAMILSLVGLRTGLGLWSPHLKLGVGMMAFLACAAIGIGGGRFVSYTLRGTRNPSIQLGLKVGERFPNFTLPDQRGAVYRNSPSSSGTLIVIYRGDFCPFARLELAELTARGAEFRKAGINVIAISADPVERSKKLGAFLHTQIPLLADPSESLLGPLGLVQNHRASQPDNAVPAFFLLDREGIVRWIFTSPYYREQPSPETLLRQAAALEP